MYKDEQYMDTKQCIRMNHGRINRMDRSTASYFKTFFSSIYPLYSCAHKSRSRSDEYMFLYDDDYEKKYMIWISVMSFHVSKSKWDSIIDEVNFVHAFFIHP